MIGLVPNLEQTFLQDIVSLGLFMNDAVDHRLEPLAMASVQRAERTVVPARNIFHQRLVGPYWCSGSVKRFNHDCSYL